MPSPDLDDGSTIQLGKDYLDRHGTTDAYCRIHGAATDADPRTMTRVAEPSELQVALEDDDRHVGVVTRATSWLLDAVAINVAAIATGLGAQLVLSLFPVSKSFSSVLKPIAAAAYIIWAAAYFVVLWSWRGQTLGARVMQIRLLTATGGSVKPVRALVRWVGMNLAMLPLFLGFAPILFRRRGFPDWLAHTKVVDAPQLSLARAQQATIRSGRDDRRKRPPATSPSEPSGSGSGEDGGSQPRTFEGSSRHQS